MPTDKEITVKAEIAKNIGGNICPINHLSISGIAFQGKLNGLIVLSIIECFLNFKTNYSAEF
tara:strand:+ start:8484 stop:8669 length:186 start_codon:yes stop_codon:yes gene_type:complete